ncbi:hypothetical protein H072_6809 [Dactylellina haptotyla CBS 200.50]|uniref:MalT-like TPR region domain-containing protein n=1 Tax=Dactylellina haptotyla (strain CBS 200.50) TaxID=1284197 RepID=S8A8U3_DACHA|nr:hypothetical protein H072_6809 [Dactylellina haptotyla CBS 200.50]
MALRIQWPSKPNSRVPSMLVRRIHSSNRLQTLPKKPYNPYVNLDHFQEGGKRKYNLFKLDTYREAYHDSPKMFSFAIFAFFVVVTLFGFTFHWVYRVMIVGLHNYPEPVAKYIRRAIFYEQKMDIDGCIQNYQRAIIMSEIIGMDPLSDEVTGLKIKYAEIAEKVEVYSKGIEYLERLRFEMLALMDDRKEELGVLKRLKLMKRVIGIAVKIGDYQLLDKDEDQAEKTFEWSVAQTMKVMDAQSRLKEGEERPWTSEEFGSVFENLASLYERANKFDYASTLYLQAANLFHPPNCHSVILLNNVGACNMQRRIPSGEPMDRNTQLESAKRWMEKALDIAAYIKPPTRTEECDQGCVVALQNLGEIEEQLGKIDEAKAKYTEAESLAHAIQYLDGYRNAGFALERIKQREMGIFEDPKQKSEEKKEKSTPGGLPPLTFSNSNKK